MFVWSPQSKIYSFSCPPEIYTVLESTHEHHTCVHAVLASSQALWGKTGAKLLQHHFFIFLAVTQSIMSDRNKKWEGSSFGLMFTREFQFFVVQKARLGTLSSVHIMVGHTCMHTHIYTTTIWETNIQNISDSNHNIAQRNAPNVFESNNQTKHRCYQYKEKAPLIIYTCSWRYVLVGEESGRIQDVFCSDPRCETVCASKRPKGIVGTVVS